MNAIIRPEIGLAVLRLSAGAFCLFAGAALAQDEAGKLAFNNSCRTCHSVDEADNRLGPNLHAIVGRKAGSIPGFAYSASLQKSEIVWDEESLDRFIENPDAVVPGNRMKPYGGMASADERAPIIAYLKSLSGGGGDAAAN